MYIHHISDFQKAGNKLTHTGKKDSSKAVVLNDASQLAPVFGVHHLALYELPKDKSPSLMPKTPHYFMELLAQKTGWLFGGYVQKEQDDGSVKEVLAGLTAALWAANFQQAIKDGLLTYPDHDNKLAIAYQEKPIIILQSVCVLGEYNKNGLSKKLVTQAIQLAQQKGYAAVFAQVAADNEKGLGLFGCLGFKSEDPWTNGHKRHLMHQRLG